MVSVALLGGAGRETLSLLATCALLMTLVHASAGYGWLKSRRSGVGMGAEVASDPLRAVCQCCIPWTRSAGLLRPCTR